MSITMVSQSQLWLQTLICPPMTTWTSDINMFSGWDYYYILSERQPNFTFSACGLKFVPYKLLKSRFFPQSCHQQLLKVSGLVILRCPSRLYCVIGMGVYFLTLQNSFSSFWFLLFWSQILKPPSLFSLIKIWLFWFIYFVCVCGSMWFLDLFL